ncbi:MAG TPA: PEGA domain-containing protein, partial [Kofleriaceae bacterium]|nr:PEGA domain-containing protein [Kofleriaceae bacterium]
MITNRTSRITLWFTALLLGALALFSSAGTAHAQACPQTKSGTKYKVKIESAPPGATVYLDRKECGAVGVTPWSGTLAAGDITVIVELDGYNPESKPLKVARSRTGSSLFVPLIKKNDPPKIDVRADADKSLFGA